MFVMNNATCLADVLKEHLALSHTTVVSCVYIKNKSLKFQYITKFLLTLLDIVVVLLYISNAATFTITEAVTIATAFGFGTDTLTAGWIQNLHSV